MLRKEEAGAEFAHEQVLRLASRILQDHQNNGTRIFAFTSVKARGGTSSIVMETAAAVVRLGVPALAVEANAYRADPRYRNNNSRGLTFVLRGNEDLEAGVVPGEGEMPDYVPLGDVEEQKNLPDIQRLIDILRASAEAYSVVFIDLPPILVSVDAEFIARGADVAVLVVEADTVTKDELKRAAACLERIKVAAVSAVLNKVSIDAGDGFAREARAQFISGALSPCEQLVCAAFLDMKIPLIYALHSGNLYGTERMALSTAAGLLDEFTPLIMAPPGPALEEAKRRGYEVAPFRECVAICGGAAERRWRRPPRPRFWPPA